MTPARDRQIARRIMIAFAFFVVAGFGAIAYILVHDEKGQKTVTHDVACSAVALTDDARLVVDCNGKQYPLFLSSGVLLTYVLNPGPLTCDVHYGGYITCKGRPFKPAPLQ